MDYKGASESTRIMDDAPSEVEVDQVYEAFQSAFHGTADAVDQSRGASSSSTSKRVDRKLLLLKLYTRLAEDLFITTEVAAPEAAESRKKRKKQSPPETNTTSTTLTHYRSHQQEKISFVSFPKEILAKIANYCSNRTDQKNLELSCRTVHRVMNNPKLCVSKLWPENCPFLSIGPDASPEDATNGGWQRKEPVSVVFSLDGSYMALVLEGDEMDQLQIVEVWHRTKGLITSIEYASQLQVNPTFSPDGQLLAIAIPDHDEDETLVKICQLEKGGVVSCHRLHEYMLSSLSFLDNHSVVITSGGLIRSDVKTMKIKRNDSPKKKRLSITKPKKLPMEKEAVSLVGKVSVVALANKGLLVLADDDNSAVVFYDLKTKSSVSRSLVTRGDIDNIIGFALDGDCLVVSHENGLSMFDCSCINDTTNGSIDDIGQGKEISVELTPGNQLTNLSFLPGTRGKRKAVAATYAHEEADYGGQICVIDIETEEVWRDFTWDDMLNN